MVASNRSQRRTVHIYRADNRHSSEKEIIGGLKVTKGISNANFLTMLTVFIFPDTNGTPYSIYNEEDIAIESNESPLEPGNYYVTGSFSVNNEAVLTRTVSIATGPRVAAFSKAVRARDGGCVISGKVAPDALDDIWEGFQAAHIFPLAYQEHWDHEKFSRRVSEPAVGGPMDSVQNGLLMKCDLHNLFDSYFFAIDVNDHYKIISFSHYMDDNEKQYLDQQLINRTDGPAKELLRWHFRQAVFANMRGAGEPVFENDFPPGTDMVGEILNGPKSAERMEFELFSRLAVHSH